MSKFYWFLGHEQYQPEVLVEHARIAEESGFDGVMVSEHLQPWVDDSGASGFAFSTLGAIAATTSKIKLMTGVVTPLFRYHPVIIAQAAATIDRLSSGRFELGLGTGENINEGPLGFKLPSYQERSDRMTEAIEIIRDLLDGKTVDRTNKFYVADELKLYSPPRSKVPILLAANGPKSTQLASKLCDGVITSVKDLNDTKNNVIDSVGDHKTKGFRIVASRWSVFANSDADAWRVLQPWRGLRAPNRGILTSPKELQAEADQIPKEEIMGQYNQLRSVTDIFNCYSPLVTDINAETVCFQMTSLDQENTIRTIGREVLPKLRKL